MKTESAIHFEVGKRLDIREGDLEPPRTGEGMIKMAAVGVCHSDLRVISPT